MSEKSEITKHDEMSVYEGGSLSQINAEDLKDNVVAIKQLINNHNIEISRSRQKDIEIQDYKSTIEYLRTSPFSAVVAAIMSISGSILMSFATNLYTQSTTPKYTWIIMSVGIVLLIVGSLSTILFPYARNWFNRKHPLT